MRGAFYGWLVLCAAILGSGGGFLLGYYVLPNVWDEPFLTPLEAGALFAVGCGMAGLVVGLIVAGSFALMEWLRRR